MRSLCVVGLGLIGGSVVRAARAAGMRVWGSTVSSADATAARADGFDVLALADAIARARQEDALVVLAMPLDGVAATLRAVDTDGLRLTDVVSVKREVADVVERVAPRARYVGGHPMAGTASSGWGAGDAELFHGARWVTCVDANSDLDVWRDVAALALSCGASVVPTGAGEHDAAVARISHLPHLLAAVLAAVGADSGPLPLTLAAGSFTDGTRVTGTRPDLVRAMCEGNASALLPVLDDALGRLGAARGALASTGTVAATVDSGHLAHEALQEALHGKREKVVLDLRAPDARTSLLALGERGGAVVELDGRTAVAEVR